MDEKQRLTEEYLKISLMEESAEICQALSKMWRFGPNTEFNGVSNIDHLVVEIADLLAIIDLLAKHKIIPQPLGEKMFTLKKAKTTRLKDYLERYINQHLKQ